MPRDIYDEVEEHVAPVRGNRRQHSGFYDTAQSAPSEPTSFHPELIEAYHKRQAERGKVGIWNKRNESWKRNNGSQRDAVHFIINW